jgi:hypothetical protein
VRQRLLGDLAREACFFARPIPEARSESMNRRAWYERAHSRAGQWPPPPLAGKNKIAGLDSGHPIEDRQRPRR